MAETCPTCGTTDEVVTLRKSLETTRHLCHHAWELIATALVAQGRPHDDLLREAIECLRLAKADVTLTQVDQQNELEQLRRENLELKYRLRRFSDSSGAVR